MIILDMILGYIILKLSILGSWLIYWSFFKLGCRTTLIAVEVPSRVIGESIQNNFMEWNVEVTWN